MKVFGVIGYPIKHSLSPAIHTQWYRQLNIDAVYGAFEVKPQDLEEALRGVRALGISGLNVTVPHKVECIKHLDFVDEAARKVGAVNTISNKNGRLEGYNTDLFGFGYALKEGLGISAKSMKRVLVFGAGGVARAVLFYFKQFPNVIVEVLNRTRSRAENLVREIGLDARISDYSALSPNYVSQFDLIVNCTSVGLKSGERLFDYENMLSAYRGKVFDLVYQREGTTDLVQACSRLGIEAIDGRLMLIAQAAKAFEIWLGVFPPVEKVRLGGE